MLKSISLVLLCFFTTLVFSCETAPLADPAFCGKFKASTECNCRALGLPSFLCQDNKALYNYMLSAYGTLDRACNAQRNTTPQICRDSWNCYFKGGTASDGSICSSTGARCDSL